MIVDHGYYAMGKFGSARDDLLHYLCSNGWAVRETGEADYGRVVWFIENKAEDVAMTNTEFNSVVEEWHEGNREVQDSQAFRDELVGSFVVTEHDSGSVDVATSGPVPGESALHWFNRIDSDYLRWDTEMSVDDSAHDEEVMDEVGETEERLGRED